MTPAEHREQIDHLLYAMYDYKPGDPEYRDLATAAHAHAQALTNAYLDTLVSVLTPPPAPGLAGLPDGWTVDVSQAMTGNRKWGYLVTGPDGRAYPPAKAQWERPETALAAGIRFAREAAAGTEG